MFKKWEGKKAREANEKWKKRKIKKKDKQKSILDGNPYLHQCEEFTPG